MVQDGLHTRVISEELITLEDGYKYYWPKDYPYGAFSAHSLREIADMLDNENRTWDEQVQKDNGC